MDLSNYYLNSRAEISDLMSLVMIYGSGFGVAILGIGVMLRSVSPAFGLQVSKFAGSIILLSIVAIFMSSLAIKYGINDVPVWVVWLFLIVGGLKILQLLIGLIFGKDVATRVIAGLLSAVFAPIAALLTGAMEVIRRIIRG